MKCKTYCSHFSEPTAFSPLGQAVLKMTCDQELWKCNVLNYLKSLKLGLGNMKYNLRKQACCVAVNFMYPFLQLHSARPVLESQSVLVSSQNPVEHISFTEERDKICETYSKAILSQTREYVRLLVLLVVYTKRHTFDFCFWQVT